MDRFDTRRLLGLIVVCVILGSGFWVAFNLEASFSSDQIVRIMPLGDSITRGYINSSYPPAGYVVGYRQELWLDLKDSGFNTDFVGNLTDGASATPPFDIDHEGLGGKQAYQINYDLNSLLVTCNPEIVLYHIGTNSLYSPGNELQAANDANESLRIIYQWNANAKVVLAQIISCNSAGRNASTHLYNQYLAARAAHWAGLGYNITVVDMENALNYATDMDPDDIHPNEYGYAKMADVWYGALDDILPVSVRPEGMISYWRMDDTSIPPIVDSYDGRDGTNVLGKPVPSTGIVNGALYFNGNTEVDVPDKVGFDWTGTDSFTVELWMNTNTVFSESKIMVGRGISESSTPDWDWWVGVTGAGKAAFGMYDSRFPYVQVTGTTTINNGVWHHIVAVRNGTEGKNRLYVDGVEQGSGTWNNAVSFSSTNALNIGYLNKYLASHGHFRYTGFLDEIAVYNGALTAAEILRHYNNGLAGKGYLETQYSLTVSTVGSGLVTKVPDQASYASGTVVTLTAVPAAGWRFAGWSGDLSGAANPATITMSGNKTVTATFTQLQYSLTVNTKGSGSVTRSPDQASYASGTVVTLTAVPAAGWRFAGWSGDLSGAANPATITMSGNKTVTATFKRAPTKPH